MLTKRILAGLLAVLLCFALVACNQPDDPDSSTSQTSDSSNTTAQSTSGSTSQTTGKPTEPANPTIPADSDDLESVQIGKYVTLRYNANAADITCEVKKGVGSKESVTITATPKNGYTFDGWTENNTIAGGQRPVSTQTTYSFTASAKTALFLNSSFTLTYHANGGAFKNGFSGTDTYSATLFLNPNTLHENGSVARDGYTLVGYNTKQDGTGEYVSLGARVNSLGKGQIDLWCVWEENTPADQFTFTSLGSGVAITQYNGTAETVTIPEKLDGKTVVQISSGAFRNNASVKKIVVGKTVQTIQRNAFDTCSALETLVIFDKSLTNVEDGCFKSCDAFQTLHINTVYTLTNDWFSCGAGKFDRLTWAKDKKKIIIVGGSGSLYGHNSAVIDEALGGEYEIINLGENANITALMYFDVIEEFITEGDIILWSPEPGSWTLGSSDCSRRFWDFRKSDYGFTQHLNLSYYDNFFSSFSTNCSTLSSSKFKNFDNLSTSMSKYGDDLSDRSAPHFSSYYRFNYPLTEKAALTELFTNISAKGGKIFFSYAAMQKTSAESFRTPIADAWDYEEMIEALPGVTSISTFENCIYEDEYFWNSEWHLTDEGSTVRSQRVAQDILKALGKID